MKVVATSCKGYGIVADEDIKANSFVCEYAGELISANEVENRLIHRESHSHNYTFTIREHITSRDRVKTKLSYIDARKKSNIARFLNHSCDPNLVPCIVRFNSEAPHIGLFAIRDISKGEELCYDYDPPTKESVVPAEESFEPKLCYCGAVNCRGYLPMTESPTV